MPKNFFQDIKIAEKIKKSQISEKFDNYIAPRVSNSKIDFDVYDQPNKNNSRYALWIVALVSIIFLFFAISFLFSRATVTINPKIKVLSLNQNFSAVKDQNGDKLQFNLTVLSGEESTLIKGGEEKDFKENAKGKVLLYNKFSSSTQTLKIDTRLEGSNNKIYKTKTKVTIPGMSKDGTPGKVSVDIYGSEEGSEYNSAPLDFKILGFKGTSKYAKFYGRSVGEISGGIIGKSRQISDAQKETVIKELNKTLEDKLFIKATSLIPEGFRLFKDSAFFKVDDTSVSSVDADGSITITTKGTIYGFIFNESKLTNKIVQFLIPDYNGADVYISNIKDLTFVLSNKENMIFSDVTNIDFNIFGMPKIVYKFNSTELISELPSRNKADFNQILSGYPNIESATVSIKPVWKSSFPEKSKNIKIVINYPE